MYQYIEQPAVANINCNPYEEILRLQCALTAGLDSDVSINWYHNGTTPLTGVTDSTEDLISEMKTLRSVLTVNNPAPATDSGDYYCQAAVDMSNLQPSDTFTLTDDENELFNLMNLRNCEDDPNTDIFFVSSTKCADVVFPTVSVTTPTTLPPQPSQTTLPTTTTPSLLTTSQSVREETSTNSPGSTEEGVIFTTQNNGSTEAAVPETLQVWIYVLVGVAAVFGIIIVILAIMCVGLCIRRSKTQDSSLSLKRELCECVCVYLSFY